MSDKLHITDLIPAYVLGSLENDERVQVDAHLKVCTACTAELDEYSQLVSLLAFAAPEVEPPPALRRKVMTAVQSDHSSKETDLNLWQLLFSAFNRPVPIWGVLAAIIVLVAAVALRQLNSPAVMPRQDSTMQTIALLGTESASEAQGLIIIGSEGVEGALVVEDLPPLDSGHQYQLWLIKGGERTSGAVFSVDDDGYTAFMLSSSIPLSHYTDFGITLEPAGGSSGPTGPKILGSSF